MDARMLLRTRTMSAQMRIKGSSKVSTFQRTSLLHLPQLVHRMLYVISPDFDIHPQARRVHPGWANGIYAASPAAWTAPNRHMRLPRPLTSSRDDYGFERDSDWAQDVSSYLHHWDLTSHQLNDEIIRRKRDLHRAVQRKLEHENQLRHRLNDPAEVFGCVCRPRTSRLEQVCAIRCPWPCRLDSLIWVLHQTCQYRDAPRWLSVPHRERSTGCCGAKQYGMVPHTFNLVISDEQSKDDVKNCSPAGQSTTPAESTSNPNPSPTSAPRCSQQGKRGLSSCRDIHAAVAGDSASCAARPASNPAQSGPANHATNVKEAIKAFLQLDLDAEIPYALQVLAPYLFFDSPASSAPSADATPAAGPTSDKDKGKAKGVTFAAPVADNASSSVHTALKTISGIESSFFALESDFVFPAVLDVHKDALASHPNSSTDSIASSESRLSYSSRNAPVRFYLHSLTALLSQLDEIESHGNEVVRERRKEVVDRVESALEDVERTIEAKLAAARVASESIDAKETPSTAYPPVPDANKPDADADALPVALKSPAATEIAEISHLPVEEKAGGDVPAAQHATAPTASEKATETDPVVANTVDTIDEADSNADDATLASTDDLVSSQTSEATITPANLEDNSSESEQDSYLLHASDETKSLSVTVQDEHIDSEPLADDLVVVDDAAGPDTGSDWSEVDA